ncbi:MAG: hypothetical protein Q8O67_12450 [Deltaproteobacteria bacterium]|nr:hypothetical protein [Deltaproteobacteria bacterium]
MHTVTRLALVAIALSAFVSVEARAQSKANDIAVDALPANVKAVLVEYVAMLRASKDIDTAAKGLVPLAGGGVVDPTGTKLRTDVPRFSLKKDFDNVKFYADPLVITRVNATPSNGQGFGASAIKGMVYKIWIGKKEGGAGMPAPISVMVPDGHATIKTPKVVNIGSL